MLFFIALLDKNSYITRQIQSDKKKRFMKKQILSLICLLSLTQASHAQLKDSRATTFHAQLSTPYAVSTERCSFETHGSPADLGFSHTCVFTIPSDPDFQGLLTGGENKMANG